ncbi:tol-pal system protein YbgF [Salinisphaera sp. T31B1]|uniref:tol-pal system protein YbgF n=1 Tax=Salinisphaera sp. T31B1 TaxID=727963 RepID=UPI003340AA70
MRHVLPIAVVTFAMATAAGTLSRPALAASSDQTNQPVLLAQNSGGPNMFSLLQDIQRLQEQVRDLRGQIDTLKYQLRQNEQGQRDLYENLDKRLSALENGSAGGTGQSSTGSDDYGSAGGGEDGEIQAQYTDAFNKLKNGQYDGAITGFKNFLQQHPESAYSDNAWYWLGEANYVQRNYDESLKAFQTVVNRFKASNKVAGSLYKIGVIQAEQGETDNARATLERVVSQYPDDSAADMARKRLQSMGG